MVRRFFVGVSGFSYPGWKGEFYPKETKGEDFLAYYAGRLGSVEINSSFYAQPSAASIGNWSKATPEGFRFSFKAPKQVTHLLKLGEGSPEASGRFFKALFPLGSKLGPILFQLPPFMKQDLAKLEKFLAETIKVPGRVFEFRHQSWLDDSTYRLLEENEAGLCVAETEDMAPVLRLIGKVAYFRLRKDLYDEKAVDSWAGRIAKASKGADECYVYLRHDDTGENAVLAQRLAASLATARE